MVPAGERRERQRERSNASASSLDNDVHQAPGHDDDLARRPPLERPRTRRRSASARRSMSCLVGVARHGDRVAPLAVHLHGQLDRLVLAQRRDRAPATARARSGRRRRGAATAPRRGAARTAPGRAGTSARCARGSVALLVASLTKIIICAIAVLKRSASVSSQHLLDRDVQDAVERRLRLRRRVGRGARSSRSVRSSTTRRQTRCRKR